MDTSNAESAPSGRASGRIHLNRMLVPVDLTGLSTFVFEYAIEVAREFQSEITLLFVVEPPVYPSWGYAHLVKRDHELRDIALDKLSKMIAETNVPDGVVIKTAVRCGDATLEISEAAKELNADVLLIATHGDSDLLHSFLGGTAEQVVRHAPCPVWTVRKSSFEKSEQPPGFRLKNILVPTDLSAESSKAIRYAEALASKFGSAVCLAHVVPSVLPTDVNQMAGLLEESALVDSAKTELGKWSKANLQDPGVVKQEVLSGSPYLEITEAANRLKTDLTIVTTHGQSALRHFLLGSTAERIVRHSRCPVLVVREQEREFVD